MSRRWGGMTCLHGHLLIQSYREVPSKIGLLPHQLKSLDEMIWIQVLEILQYFDDEVGPINGKSLI